MDKPFFEKVTGNLFPLGQLLVTPGAMDLPVDAIMRGVTRHSAGDWGDLDEFDRSVNQDALKHGGRLMSVYQDGEVRFWIITESDRSATTVLLPREY